MTVNIHEAKTRLSQLIECALHGDDVIIAKAGKPVVRLTLVEFDAGAKRVLGSALPLMKQGIVRETPGWEDPLTEAEVDQMFGL